jgi:hypothetical protein
MGQYFEVEFPSFPESDGAAIFLSHSDKNDQCHLFGVLLYQIFCNSPPILAEETHGTRFHNNNGRLESTSNMFDEQQGLALKKNKMIDLIVVGVSENSGNTQASHGKSYLALKF